MKKEVINPSVYKAVFDKSIDGILAADIKTRKVVFANTRICRITGYPLKELLKLNINKIHPKKDLPYVLEQFKKQIQGKITLAKDIPILRKDKKIVYCDINSIPIKIGKQKLLLGLFRDITERIKAEKKIRESEERYKTTFENTGTAMIIVEGDTTISLANHQFELLAGYSKEEIEGKMKCTKFVIKEDLERMKEYHNKRRKKGEKVPNQYEFHFVDKKGNMKNVFLTVNIIPGTKKSVASLIDITSLRKTEEKLKKLTNHLDEEVNEKTKELKELGAFNENIIKKAPIGIYTINRKGVIDSFNPTMVKIAGAKNTKQIIGLNALKINSYKKAGLTPYFKKGLEGISFSLDDIEYFSHTKGTKSVRHYTGVPIKNEKGKVVRLLLLVQDITQRKKAEEELKKLNEELEQKVEDRTKEIKAKMDDLERWNRLAIGRELRMVELKKKIKELEEKVKK